MRRTHRWPPTLEEYAYYTCGITEEILNKYKNNPLYKDSLMGRMVATVRAEYERLYGRKN